MAIEYAIRIGLALNCSIATWCRFARKTGYFYPDMPKNFQISQYDEPLCTDGYLDVRGFFFFFFFFPPPPPPPLRG